jgi:hypothetical protein
MTHVFTGRIRRHGDGIMCSNALGQTNQGHNKIEGSLLARFIYLFSLVKKTLVRALD